MYEPDLSPAVFALYGKVMHTIQQVESHMLSLLTWGYLPGTATLQDFGKRVRQSHDGETMGQLLGALQEAGLPDEVSRELRRVLEDRNYLCHRFFRTEDGGRHDVRSVEKCKAMLEELAEMDVRLAAVREQLGHHFHARFVGRLQQQQPT